jgi:hypothetical protein
MELVSYGCGQESTSSGYGPKVGFCQLGNGPSGSGKGDFLTRLATIDYSINTVLRAVN